MVVFVIGIIIAIAGVFVGAGSLAASDAGAGGLRIGCVAAVVIGIFGGLLLGGFKDVPTKSIGVPVSFGKVTGSPYGPGLHETWQPWKHLQVLDETVQTSTFEGCQGVYCQHGDQVGRTTLPQGDSGSSSQPCLEVRIGGQQTACLDVTIQWRVRDNAADSLFSDYANQGNLMPTIENAVVIRELRQVENLVLGDYSPIADAVASASKGASRFTTFQPLALRDMNADIGSRVKIVSLLMPLLRYDASTQARLNSIQQTVGNTAIAEQEIKTNEALATAYGKLSKILASNPNVLVSQCLDLVQTAEKDGYLGLPSGFGCIPNSSTAVSVGPKK